MSRVLIAAAWVLSLACGLAGGPARADVMEIGSQGFAWVAGGPVQRLPDALAGAAPGADALDMPVSADAVHAASFTGVADAAGPEQWRNHVGALAAKYDISPALLEALVWQESRWRPGAVSSAGARGLAQLMPGTARAMGVDPRDPFANLEGGARYLRIQLDTFGGDLEKALAAYNAGPARVAAAGGIPRIAETQAYVAAIMARLAAPVR